MIKDTSGDCSSLSNYRPITLGPLYLQVFENTLLQKFGHYLFSDNLYSRTRLFRSHWDLRILTVILKVCYNKVELY